MVHIIFLIFLKYLWSKFIRNSSYIRPQKAKKKEKKEKKESAGRVTKYDYPLIEGREMTSDEKKKYRMEQRRLAAGKAPKEEKPKKEKAEATEKAAPAKKDKKAKDKKKKKAKKEED